MNGKLINDDMSLKIIEVTEKLVTERGANSVNVKQVLSALGITNRVFYNRFSNIEEVLDKVYERMALKIRESLINGIDSTKDFFEQIIEIVTNTLVRSYENKMHFNLYFFENDSLYQSNFEWWMSEIKKIIEYAKSRGYIKDLDTNVMSYTIWCFIRGYNADALGRGIKKEKATSK